MENVLVIKTGAAGDVVRTTSLLNVLEGNIYWVTADECKPLLPEDIPALKILSLEDAFRLLSSLKFRRVISLEEDKECARLATEAGSDDLTGIYLNNGNLNYTDNSAGWFDLSRVSKFGLKRANELKMQNNLSYQHHIFRMIGKQFQGEPYRIFTDKNIRGKDKLVGIERHIGKQWPDKQWWGYEKLIEKLNANGIAIKEFVHRPDIRDYLTDIAGCSHIVSGDSLAMHLALAYKKTCTAIFNCTSPQEIYDYGLLRKVVSPLLSMYFYSTSFDKEVIESVTVDEVFRTIPH